MDRRSNAANHSLCHFSYADGRRCRMLRHRDHPGLCPFHSREERQRLESERIGTELAASLSGNYLTASDINHVLGKVFTALAQDRISIKKAKALAYVAQLMLYSLRWAKSESQIRYPYESWQHMLQNATKLPEPLPATSNDFANAVFATAEAHAAPRDRHSPNSQRGAADSVGAGFSPSPAARREDCAAAAEDANGRARLQPCQKQGQRHSHLSSPHPSAPSADACGDSSHRAPNNATNDYTNEDNTEEPALVSAGPSVRQRT